MKTAWFTFGQSHAHALEGITLDKDIVLEIHAENPRQVMFELFGKKWAHEYDHKPDMGYFPRGIHVIAKLRDAGESGVD